MIKIIDRSNLNVKPDLTEQRHNTNVTPTYASEAFLLNSNDQEIKCTHPIKNKQNNNRNEKQR